MKELTRSHIYNTSPSALQFIVDGIVEHQDILSRYGIDTDRRLWNFLGQCAHESNGFKSIEENLNYSAAALPQMFSYFRDNPKEALQFGRTDTHPADQEAIANRAYCNRMGNGPPESGDGWRYRGSGLIQLTGKNNYVMLESATGANVIDFPEFVREFPMALMAACVYWNRANCNRFADANDIDGLTRAINGGLNGLNDRIIYTSRARKALQ